MRKVVLCLLVGILLTSVVMAQDTYTMVDYLKKFPEWEKIDTSKMIPPADTTLFQHRHWYLVDSLIEQEIFDIELSDSKLSNYHILLYVWCPTGVLQDPSTIYILVVYNKTAKSWVYAMWIQDENVYFKDFPKDVCDYSIMDLPLKPTDYRKYFAILGIVGISLIAISAVIPAKKK